MENIKEELKAKLESSNREEIKEIILSIVDSKDYFELFFRDEEFIKMLGQYKDILLEIREESLRDTESLKVPRTLEHCLSDDADEDEEEYINKSEIVFKVENFSNSTEKWKMENYDEGLYIGITVFINDENTNGPEDTSSVGYMVDQHIVELFPELAELGLVDESEGFIGYRDNDKTEEQLKIEIRKLGFNVK